MNHTTQRTTRRRRTAPRWRSAIALVELYFAFPLLLCVSFGMVEFGQYFYIKQAFQAAARDGTRVAILPSATQSQVVTAMTNTLLQANVTYNSSWLTMTDVTTGTAVNNVSTVPSGDTLRITLLATYTQLPNVVRPLHSIYSKTGIHDGKQINGQCAMVRE